MKIFQMRVRHSQRAKEQECCIWGVCFLRREVTDANDCSCCGKSLPGLRSVFSLYNKNILVQRTIACPISFNKLLSKLELAMRAHKSEINQVPGSLIYIYHLSVFARRNSERTHICLYRILTCEMFWIAYSIFLLVFGAKKCICIYFVATEDVKINVVWSF